MFGGSQEKNLYISSTYKLANTTFPHVWRNGTRTDSSPVLPLITGRRGRSRTSSVAKLS